MSESAEIDAAVSAVLDEVEARIRAQTEAEPLLSMEWRMGMACLAHVSAVRLELTRVIPAGADRADD